MTKEILIIIACVPLYILNAFADKFISSKYGNSFFYNSVKFLICTLCLLPAFIGDKLPKFTAGCIICGVTCGILYIINKTTMLKGYESTSVSFMTLCHSAGMILPCIVGAIIWNERLSVISVIGMLLTVVSMFFLKSAKSESKKMNLHGVLLGVLVFLSSGINMLLQKIMGLCFKDESVIAYNFYSFAVAFAVLNFFIKPKEIKKENFKFILPAAAISAVSLCIVSTVMTSLSSAVPSVILFPLFNGMGIVCVCIGSVFAFKEKLDRRKLFGLFVGVIGLCLVNF